MDKVRNQALVMKSVLSHWRIFTFVAIAIFLAGCRPDDSREMMSEAKEDSTNRAYEGLNGTWRVYKSVKSTLVPTDVLSQEAVSEKETSSSFHLANDSLVSGDCGFNFVKYTMPKNAFRRDTWATYINLRPNLDSVSVIGPQFSSAAICGLCEGDVLMLYDEETIVGYDRGYYFYYQR